MTGMFHTGPAASSFLSILPSEQPSHPSLMTYRTVLIENTTKACGEMPPWQVVWVIGSQYVLVDVYTCIVPSTCDLIAYVHFKIKCKRGQCLAKCTACAQKDLAANPAIRQSPTSETCSPVLLNFFSKIFKITWRLKQDSFKKCK